MRILQGRGKAKDDGLKPAEDRSILCAIETVRHVDAEKDLFAASTCLCVMIAESFAFLIDPLRTIC